MLGADDLRLELGYSSDEWTVDDGVRADAILARSRTVVRGMVGSHRINQAEADVDQDKLDAIDEATMVLAVARFSNPERWLQRNQGTGRSVSMADSSDAAGGRREAREILRGAFGTRQGSTTL